MVERIELQLVLQNLTESSAKSMTDSFAAWTKLVRDNQMASGVGSLSKFGSEISALTEKTNMGTAALNLITNSLATMGGSLLMTISNPVVLGGTLVSGAALQLKRFTETQTDLKKLATDSGLSMQAIREISNTFEMMGKQYKEGGEFAVQFGATLNELQNNQRESQTYIEPSQMGERGRVFADRLLAEVNAGKSREEILQWLSEEYIRQGQRTGPGKAEGERVRIWMQNKFADHTVLQNYATLRGRIVIPYKYTDEDLANQEKFNRFWINSRIRFYEAWQAIENAGVAVVVGAHRANVGRASTAPGAAILPLPLPYRALDLFFGGGKSTSSGVGGGVEVGGSARRANREDLTPEREEARLLSGIRDTLQKMEFEAVAGSGDANVGGGGRGALARRLGMYQGTSTGVYGGSYGRQPGRSGANFLGSDAARSAGISAGVGSDLVTVQTKAGPITVNKSAAPDLAGAVNELVEAGAPVGRPGSFNQRKIAGSDRWSQHAFGGALDMFGQTGRGVISREGLAWIRANPEKWLEIKRKYNLVGGEDFGDIGHVEWGGPNFGSRRYADSKAPVATTDSGPVESGAVGLFKAARERFKGSVLDGFVPKDGEMYGIRTGSPDEWARLAVALGMQESSLNPNVRNGLFQFGPEDLARRGIDPSRVGDPSAQLDAMVKQFATDIPKSGYIGGRDDSGWRGGARYFEPIRYPSQLSKHWGMASRAASSAGPSEPTEADLAAAQAAKTGLASGLDSLQREWGGSIGARRPYLVGERGPELIVPGEDGYVIPNHELDNFRAMLDRAATRKASVKSSPFKASIAFRNVPQGVKTSVDSDGIDQLRISRDRAMTSDRNG